MRVVFIGSGQFGLPTLQALTARHDVAAVVSQPDRPAGRKAKVTATQIAQWAHNAQLNVLKSDDVNGSDFVEQVAHLQADAGVVIAFGQKLSPPLIAALGGLAINLHASLLPKYRGAAPINWAIINGEQQTGLSAISLSQHMDGGQVYAQATTPIEAHETAGELHDRLAAMGPDVVVRVLTDFQAGTLRGRPQDESQMSRAPKLTKAHGQVNFDDSPQRVRNYIHGLTPWPGVAVQWRRKSGGDTALLYLRRVEAQPGRTHDAPPGTLLDDRHVAVRGGAIALLEVQMAGGRVTAIDDFVRGHPLKSGDQLQSP